jgi:nitrogen fixation/metabolism regulation signal transduction histidine kinase
MKRLLPRLVLVFLAATLVPLAATLWLAGSLIEQSLEYGAIGELDRVSKLLEQTGQTYYQAARAALEQDVDAGRLSPKTYSEADAASWPGEVAEFWRSETPQRFLLSGPAERELHLLRRMPNGVAEYSRSLDGPGMLAIAEQYRAARALVDHAQRRDLRRGLITTLVLIASPVWVVSLVLLVFLAHRVTRPIRRLNDGLAQLAGGDLDARVEGGGEDEVGAAIRAFNHMAEQLRQSRGRLLYLTRLASWQSLARKMAHELKNSLTPIRLNVEEIVARSCDADRPLVEPAAQIVIDEIESLQRRVQTFSEFAAEPEVRLESVDVGAAIEERIAFLAAANRETRYELETGGGRLEARCDADLLKGILTNLLENAAQAAGAGGRVLAKTTGAGDAVTVEIHDSGPGLSPNSRETLFEPTISFKRGGTGLGLSIARKSALLCGGDLDLVNGELGGAAFRLTLPAAANGQPRRDSGARSPLPAVNT